VSLTDLANVRYLAPLIPLFIGLSALVIVPLAKHKWPLVLLLALIVFGSNVLNHPFSPGKWSCRPAEFIRELFIPQVSSFDIAVKWIEDNIHKGESIWVVPDYMGYPLMYHAPQPVYAWQLQLPPQKQFAALPPIHFNGLILTDYFIAFGPYKGQVDGIIEILKSKGINYQLIEILDVYWLDRTRPEIIMRIFHTIKDFDHRLRAVYVYRRVTGRQLK
jgi:hypothetical protein